MFTLAPLTDGLGIEWEDQPIAEYHFGQGGSKPYFHPLRLPGSPALTMNQPADHVHHQGLFVGWKLVNGVNFWEQPGPGEAATGYGRIVHQAMSDRPDVGERVRFATRNAWVDWEGTQHVAELREATIHAPRDGYWVMDLRFRFEPHGRDVTLDLKRGTPGAANLFYSGLTVRFDNSMTPGQLLDADGRTDTAEVFGSNSRWCGFSGRHGEDGEVYGVTMVDHPDNPGHPTTWWVRNAENYGLLSPSPCYHEPLVLRLGDSLNLRYRVVVHRGRVDPELIESLDW